MRVLLLSPYPERLTSGLVSSGDSFNATCDQISLAYCLASSIDFIVSYGYRHIIDPEIIKHYHNKCINLHISLLPIGRGAHPNFWSIVEGQSSGVTIHLVDEGLDTGKILFQSVLELDHTKHTFATSYNLLCLTVEKLFSEKWSTLRSGLLMGYNQVGDSSFHRVRDLQEWQECLPFSWDTPISVFKQLAGGREKRKLFITQKNSKS